MDATKRHAVCRDLATTIAEATGLRAIVMLLDEPVDNVQQVSIATVGMDAETVAHTFAGAVDSMINKPETVHVASKERDGHRRKD